MSLETIQKRIYSSGLAIQKVGDTAEVFGWYGKQEWVEVVAVALRKDGDFDVVPVDEVN